jgi:hypothetical protein
MLMSLLRFDFFYISSQIRLDHEQNFDGDPCGQKHFKRRSDFVINFVAELPFVMQCV